MSSDRENILLQEYILCNEQIGRLDSLIWQTASLLFPITLAGFAFFGTLSKHTAEQFFTLLAVAIGSITLLVIWHSLTRLWFRFQSIAFYRIQELESELGLWRFRYSAFLGKPSPKRKAELAEMDVDVHARFQKLENRFGNFRGIGLRHSATSMTIIFILGWVGLVIREYFLTFIP